MVSYITSMGEISVASQTLPVPMGEMLIVNLHACSNLYYLILYRGLTFREAFARIKEVRIAMPSHVGIMALTATATKQVREKVQVLIGMRDPLYIIRSPDKINMLFSSIAIKGYNSYEVSKFLMSFWRS